MLNEKSMLVKLTTTKWTARSIDRAASERVIKEANAVDGIGSFSKRLLPAAATAPVTEVINKARAYHNKMTCPWDDNGWRLLPVRVFEEYKKVMDEYVTIFGDARNEVVKEYVYWKDVAEKELRDLYDSSDYPSMKDIGEEMKMSYEVLPVPDANHIVVDLDRDSVDEVKNKINKANAKRISSAMTSLHERVKEVVMLCADKLEDNDDGSQKIIRQSVLDKMREVAQIVPILNIVDDENLAKMCDDLRDLTDNVSAEQLREHSESYDAEKRAQVKESLNDMSDKFSGMYNADSEESPW